MTALLQRLREMHPSKFELLCFHVLKERYPGANIRRVEGAGGDKGIDAFCGELLGGLSIWQCKYFPNGVKRAQRRQIEKSLNTSLRHFTPTRWILCLPIDFDVNNHIWFQDLQRRHAGVEIGLFQGSDIVGELIVRRPLLEVYFPGAILDVAEIKSLLSKAGDFTREELEKVSIENLQEYLKRLQNKDPRLTYRITYPYRKTIESLPDLKSEPGLIFSLFDGQKKIDAFARDAEALKLDPPTVQIRMKEAGFKKMQHAITTGSTVEFGDGEIFDVSSSLVTHLMPRGFNPKKVVLFPSQATTNGKVHLGMKFRSKLGEVVYPFVEFVVTKRGTEEVEMTSVSHHLPVKFSLIFRRSLTMTLKIEETWADKEVEAVRELNRMFEILASGATLDLQHLESNKLLGRADISPLPLSNSFPKFKHCIDDLFSISQAFGVSMRVPQKLSRADSEGLNFLLQVVKQGKVAMKGDSVTLTFLKDEGNRNLFANLEKDQSMKLEKPNYEPAPSLLGTKFMTGPCAFYCQRLRATNPEDAKASYLNSPNGGAVAVEFKCLTPLEVYFTKFHRTATAGDWAGRNSTTPQQE